jgi:hypothetical protein
LKYGSLNFYEKFNFDNIREFWHYNEPYPSPCYLKKNIRIKSIKWFLYNKMDYQEGIWNADFLNGLMAHTKITWNRLDFPSCEWYGNKMLAEIIRKCPFGGKIVEVPKARKQKWIGVPALVLKNSEDSISFMTGLMTGMILTEKDNIQYAMASGRVESYLKMWGIPIECKWREKMVLISPIWPALFANHMPTECKKRWMEVKNPFEGSLYAAILWKTYVDDRYPSNGIPYLKSRRMVYYDFKCEEGTTKRLEMLRIEKGLTGLDNRIRDIIGEWKKGEEHDNGKRTENIASKSA